MDVTENTPVQNRSLLNEREKCEEWRPELVPKSFCPPSWDGALCWPATAADSLATQHCFAEFNGVQYDPNDTATRWCYDNGSWSRSNYSSCRDLVSASFEVSDGWSVELSSMLYQVGYTLSLVALVFAVFIFLSFKDLHCLRNVIHSNLMCAYILEDFTWIVNYQLQQIQTTQRSSIPCPVMFILLQYFHLTTFFWMFVEGLYLYILVVETFTRENVNLRCYLLIGWGSPGLLTLFWVIVRCVTPIPEPQGWQDESLIIHCTWMIPHLADWVIQAPALVILSVNSVFLIVIMWVLITKLRSATSPQTQQSRKAAKALLVLMPLLGMNYVVTIVEPPETTATTVYAPVIRAILLSTQGLSVAMLYCFLNAEVQRALHHRWHRWREARELSARPCPACAKDWSPRSRTESIRLYCAPTPADRKRESTTSQSTTTTLLSTAHQLHQTHHPNLEHTV